MDAWREPGTELQAGRTPRAGDIRTKTKVGERGGITEEEGGGGRVPGEKMTSV